MAKSIVQLARKVAAGDRASLDEFLRELQPLVVRTTRLIVGSGSPAAEDAAQEALLDVARGIGTLREPEAARSWAIRVAATRALKVARRERLMSLRRSELEDQGLAAAPPDGR